MTTNATLTKEQKEELAKLKEHFPYRIVFGVIRKDTGEFQAWCKTTMASANCLARKGHNVFIYRNA